MTTLLENTYILDKSHFRTHYRVPFYVPEGVRTLVVKVSYFPKTCEDKDYCEKLTYDCMMSQAGEELFSKSQLRVYYPLKNHLSFSLDDPDGWRGTAHRGDESQQFVVSDAFASEGFFQGAVKSGQWAFTASVNSIVTDTIKMTLTVEAEI